MGATIAAVVLLIGELLLCLAHVQHEHLQEQAVDAGRFTRQLFAEAADRYEQQRVRRARMQEDNRTRAGRLLLPELAWYNHPKQWHQQMARVVDHTFTTFADLETFAHAAKRAGVSSLMLVHVQKTDACPGWWYNGLELCDHINGSFPARDGTLPVW